MTAPLKIRFVCATRESVETFPSQTPLGKSMAVYSAFGFAELRLFPNNDSGLPQVYNTAIRESKDNPAVLVFVHDDVHLCGFYWADDILGGLRSFPILGVAGNRRRVPKQPAWCFLDDRWTFDTQNLSGVVGHGPGFPPRTLDIYGPPGQEVKLLDGVMLVAHSETLLANELFFDERFDFHFYDIDFCRQAEQKRIRMGTWPISIVHESKGGRFASEAWRAAYGKYLQKWND